MCLSEQFRYFIPLRFRSCTVQVANASRFPHFSRSIFSGRGKPEPNTPYVSYLFPAQFSPYFYYKFKSHNKIHKPLLSSLRLYLDKLSSFSATLRRSPFCYYVHRLSSTISIEDEIVIVLLYLHSSGMLLQSFADCITCLIYVNSYRISLMF